VKFTAALAVLWVATVTWLGFRHPYGLRFAMGIWPVPQGTPWTYQLESGFVPALTVLTLLSAVTSLYHLHNCHTPGCWRTGKHRVNGAPWCDTHVGEVKPERSENDLLTSIEGLLTEIRDRL